MANHPNKSQSAEEGQLPVPVGTVLEVYDFGEDAGAGAGQVGLDDLITPRLTVLHYQCPQIDRHDSQYVPGAEPGMIFNTASRELYPGEEGVDVMVCGRKKRYLVRLAGGDVGQSGFRGFLDPGSDHKVAKLIDQLKAQHPPFKPLPWTNDDGESVELVETGEMYVLYALPPLRHDNARRAMVNFKGTSLSARYAPYGWKSFNSRYEEWVFPHPDGTMKKAPIWAFRWRLRSQRNENKFGKFFVWSLDLAPPARWPGEALVGRQDPLLFEMGRERYKEYLENKVEYQPQENDADVSEHVPF